MTTIRKFLPLFFLILGIILYFGKFIAIFPVLVLAVITCLSFFEKTRIIGTIFFIILILSSAFILIKVFLDMEERSNPNKRLHDFRHNELVCVNGECVIECHYYGTNITSWTKWYDDGYHMNLSRWGCSVNIDQDGYTKEAREAWGL
tara:strand:- start:308 stop:748 length:441 start_codon:yes stop_codon:yes gene_type:complete